MPAVKIFGQTVHSFRRFFGDMVYYRDLATNWSDQFQNGYVFLKTVLASFLGFIMPVGVFLLSREPESTAAALVLLFFIIMAPGTAAPLYKLMFISAFLEQISEGVERIDAVFSESPVVEPASPKVPETYDVEFDSVHFSYQETEASTRSEALSGISFKADSGVVTALVGPSGSGKTTAANLIPRFWDVDQGSIRIGGIDVRDIRTEDLMNTTAFVFQDTFSVL